MSKSDKISDNMTYLLHGTAKSGSKISCGATHKKHDYELIIYYIYRIHFMYASMCVYILYVYTHIYIYIYIYTYNTYKHTYMTILESFEN